MSVNAEKILIRGVNWIGDAVMTMPAIRALRRVYPRSRVSLLVKPSVAPLFEKDPNIDEIILYEKRFEGFIGKLRLAKRLKKMGFSKAILFQNAFDAALITYIAGIPERIGYDRDGRGLLLTKPADFNDSDRNIHHINYYLNLLTRSGIIAGQSCPWIYLSLNERFSARSQLSGLRRPLLGINPGATYGSAKRWLPARFAEIANWFMKDTGGSVVVFGGPSEVGIVEDIFRKIETEKLENWEDKKIRSEGTQSLNLAGKTSLRELISLISECDAFVTNDSGPMHIAYAVGTPLVAIFGSTCPSLTGPPGNENIVIKSDLSCSPCFERTCRNRDMRCMYGVTSEEVYLGIKKILPGRRAVFFDRDGTLCRDIGYLNTWKDLKVFPEIANLSALKEKGFSLIGISNQSGIARGIVDESFMRAVNKVFTDKYGFDDFYYCPHHPDEHCLCRKPEPGMLLVARSKHGINLRGSYVVGDKEADMLLAKAVGAKGILVLTGAHKESPYADLVANDLKEVVDLIIRDKEARQD